MGYTHYWEALPTVTVQQWNDFCDDVQKLLENPHVKLCGWTGEAGTSPEVIKCLDNTTKGQIAFNGHEDESHESFVLNFFNSEWDFCKTARKRYDRIVVAVLTLAHHRLGLQVNSDGGSSEWRPGIKYVNKVLNTNFTKPKFYER